MNGGGHVARYSCRHLSHSLKVNNRSPTGEHFSHYEAVLCVLCPFQAVTVRRAVDQTSAIDGMRPFAMQGDVRT